MTQKEMLNMKRITLKGKLLIGFWLLFVVLEGVE